jgi:hypothetical protein
VKPTLPVGAVPVTVAVNVTLIPASTGLAELTSVVIVAVEVPPGAVTCIRYDGGMAQHCTL